MEIKEILEKISYPARSKKKGFYETEKLEAIEKLLKETNSPFYLVKKSDFAWIFGKKDFDYGSNCLLVSSHADIVSEIKKPYTNVLEDSHYFKGTYDNMGTNAAAVFAMINYDLPNNAYFAFTADEETGRCLGAGYALTYIQSKTGHNPFCISLDVTAEGYGNNRLFTIESLNAPKNSYHKPVLEKLLGTEGKQQSFEVITEKDYKFLPKEYVKKEQAWFDEGAFYGEQGIIAFSMCLPTYGEMHDETGLYVKEPVMKGYAESLVSVVHQLTMPSFPKDYKEENQALVDKINKKKEIIEKIASIKDTYVTEAKEIDTYRYAPKTTYWSNALEEYKLDEEIEGQMSLADFGYDLRTGKHISDEDYYDDDMMYSLEDVPIDDIFEELSYEVMNYAEDEFPIFFADACDFYGLDYEDVAIRTQLFEMFNDVQSYKEYE